MHGIRRERKADVLADPGVSAGCADRPDIVPVHGEVDDVLRAQRFDERDLGADRRLGGVQGDDLDPLGPNRERQPAAAGPLLQRCAAIRDIDRLLSAVAGTTLPSSYLTGRKFMSTEPTKFAQKRFAGRL